MNWFFLSESDRRLSYYCMSALLMLTSATATADETTAHRARWQTVSNEEVAQARNIFLNTCGFCHAKGGRKASKGPKLSNTERSNEFIFERIQNGKAGRMPAFGGAFNEEQIWALIAYIRRLED